MKANLLANVCFPLRAETTTKNPFSWNTKASLLFIDQPAGVGFSYGDSKAKDHNEAGVREDMYYFVQAFLAAHPQFQKNEFFVFGESYGGHYAPSTAWRIVAGNNNLQLGNVRVNLAGLAVGNGLTEPTVQYKYYSQVQPPHITTLHPTVLPHHYAIVPPQAPHHHTIAPPQALHHLHHCPHRRKRYTTVHTAASAEPPSTPPQVLHHLHRRPHRRKRCTIVHTAASATRPSASLRHRWHTTSRLSASATRPSQRTSTRTWYASAAVDPFETSSATDPTDSAHVPSPQTPAHRPSLQTPAHSPNPQTQG